jgi:hypothetical protein
MYVDDRKIVVVFSIAHDPGVLGGRCDHELPTPAKFKVNTHKYSPHLRSSPRDISQMPSTLRKQLTFRTMQDKGPNADDVRLHLMDHQAQVRL